MNRNLLSSREVKPSTTFHAVALREKTMKKASFLAKLRYVLSLKSIEEIVSWLPEGKIWRIHKVESFKAAVLPLFYEGSTWETFLLILGAHGFKEVSRGVDSVAFYNEVSRHTKPHQECKHRWLTVHSLDYEQYCSRGDSTAYSLVSTQCGGALQGTSDLLASVPGRLNSSVGSMVRGGRSTAQGSFTYHMEPKHVSVHQLPSPFERAHSRITQGMNLVDLFRLETLAKGARADAQKENERKRKVNEEDTSSTSSSASTPSKKKKTKKKWLPPLGPPEAESAAILGKRLAGSWGHTSAEAFSTLSGLRG